MSPGNFFWKSWRRQSRLERGVAAFVLLVCFVVVELWPGEPRYGGRGLSSWLDEYRNEKSARSREAISAIGERALPVVYRGFDTNHILLPPAIPQAKQLADAWESARWETTMGDALSVLEVLGPRAKGALPMLRARLNERNLCGAAEQGIFFVEGFSAETLRWTMKHGNPLAQRMSIAWFQNKEWGPGVFELLGEARTNADWRMRPWAFRTLLYGEVDAETHRGFVMEALTNALVGVRQRTLDYLARNPGEIGSYVAEISALTNTALCRTQALTTLRAAGLIPKGVVMEHLVPRPDDRKKMAGK